MKILSECYGYSLIFKDDKDLDHMTDFLKTSLEEFKKEKVKPPYIVTFYSTDGVTTEFVKKELTKLKKDFGK